MSDTDNASVAGRGYQEMVPEKGIPFDIDAPSPAGAETAPPDLTPRDLGPDELAALQPSTHEDRAVESGNGGDVAAPPPAPPAPAIRVDGGGMSAGAEPLPVELPPAAPPLTDYREGLVPQAIRPEVRPMTPPPAAPMAVPPPGARPYAGSIYDMPGPASPPVDRPVQDLTADANLLGFLVTDARVEGLWNRATAAQKRITEMVDNKDQANALLDKLQNARTLILSKREYYEEAERQVAEVEFSLQFSERVEKWSRSYGTGLFFYEIAWAVALGAVILFVIPGLAGRIALSSLTPSDVTDVRDLSVALNTMAWGGLGGVVGALYTLWTHVSRDQDFDKQYTLWYIANPVMGVILGSFIYLIVRAGLFSISSRAAEAGITSAWLIYMLAWLAGFQQNVAYELVRRILKIFMPEDTSQTSQAAGGPTAPSPKK